MLEKLKKLFKLADDAGEDKVVEAVEAIVAKNKALESAAGDNAKVVACKEVLEALKVEPDATKEQVIIAVGTLGAPADAARELSLQVAKLTTELGKMKQEDLTELALKDGKTSPEELESWGNNLALKNPEQFKLIVLSRPAGSVISVSEIGPGPKDKAGALGDAALTIAKQFGNTEEDLKKYGTA